ncbi:hypothetical protein HPB48_015201 [Haemaphysalis longicornis]|uniref:ADP-ribosylhydrolase ARH3 n=1 Tax=Haemaphysalis longicornis TaxID=44386 RepID=A0A9J6FLE3_HAELO|nr:hypothetical protein HPB48_015201 [Haemaphysalis longicornis]
MSADTTLVEKFEGCLVGALLGDCLGAPFETDFTGSNFPNQQNFFQNLLQHTVVPGPSAGRNFHPSKVHPGRGEYHYTDDTAMTLCLAKSLLAKRRFDALDVAKRFTTEYFENEALDPYKPAQEQFGGRGSYGNGASMRVAPVALFYMDDLEKMIEVARNQAKITHSNQTGYNAAILQCMAVFLALKSDPKAPLDPVAFIDHLIAFMDKLEEAIDGFNHGQTSHIKLHQNAFHHESWRPPSSATAYVLRMKGERVYVADVCSQLVSFFFFFSFRRPLIFNPFVRCLYFAVVCGGDADTLASMACSISGARHGVSAIPGVLQRQCQAIDEVTRIADCLEEALAK